MSPHPHSRTTNGETCELWKPPSKGSDKSKKTMFKMSSVCFDICWETTRPMMNGCYNDGLLDPAYSTPLSHGASSHPDRRCTFIYFLVWYFRHTIDRCVKSGIVVFFHLSVFVLRCSNNYSEHSILQGKEAVSSTWGGHWLCYYMASRINFYSYIAISLIRISDISNYLVISLILISDIANYN